MFLDGCPDPLLLAGEQNQHGAQIGAHAYGIRLLIPTWLTYARYSRLPVRLRGEWLADDDLAALAGRDSTTKADI